MGATALLLLALGAAGEMTLEVDLREAPRRLIHARMTIPARPGPVVLVYPKWVQGSHAPYGPLADVTGFHVTAGGKALAWKRDEADLHAVTVEVPQGASQIEVALDLVGARNFTTRLATLRWSSALVYPRGTAAAAWPVRASVLLPPGWAWGAALAPSAEEPGRVAFAPVSLETLVDSPLLAGRFLKRFPIGPASGPPHALVLAAETEEGLVLPAAWKDRLDRLVAEAHALFGGRHYRRYDFLLALSDHLDHYGLEHHESSDIYLPERFLKGEKPDAGAHLLAHELIHSWNGKFRRPRGLVVPDMQEPLRTSGLWIYEGLTQYLGFVLSARAGIHTAEQFRDVVATTASGMALSAGREWRSLGDTATSAPVLAFAGGSWASRRRSTYDYYADGMLLWLEVDALLREKSGGTRSLDDFCRAFFGGDGPPEVRPFDVADVAAALQGVVAHDWAGFLAGRVEALRPGPPVAGIERAGWRVARVAKAGPAFSEIEAVHKRIDLRGSLGLALGAERNNLSDVVPGSPADRAGLAPGGRVVAVNGRRMTREVLLDAVEASPAKGSVELLVEDADFFRTHALEYRGGPRYPALERDPARPDLLSAIAAPRAAPVTRASDAPAVPGTPPAR